MSVVYGISSFAQNHIKEMIASEQRQLLAQRKIKERCGGEGPAGEPPLTEGRVKFLEVCLICVPVAFSPDFPFLEPGKAERSESNALGQTV
jgi:hypothetical protein